MKALVLRADAKGSSDIAKSLIDRGFQVMMVGCPTTGHALARLEAIDLMIMDEQIDG